MMIKKSIIGILLAPSLFAGSINIAVATNVSYAIDTLKKEFNKLHPDTKVNVTLGSSGKLTAQIKNGAPYSLFMSANMKYPQALYKSGIATIKPRLYAKGSLAFFSSKKQDLNQSIKLLESPTIHKIAIANPKIAPYGIAAIQFLKNAGIYEKIKNKFVYGESISQTLSYTMTAVDIGLVAKSALFSPKMSHYKKGVHWADVDSKLYTPINQGIVILKNGEKNSEVLAFYNFMLRTKARKILSNFGYLVP